MTHECDHHNLRERLFDARRDELSKVDAALLHEELAQCSECSRFAERLGEMMGLAKEADLDVWLPEHTTPAAHDDLFAAITDAIEDDIPDAFTAPTIPLVQNPPTPLFPAEDNIVIPPSYPWFRIAAAAAIVLAAGIGLWFALGLSGKTETSDTPTTIAQQLEQPQGPLAAMKRADSPTSSITVFASKGARYTLSKEPPYALELTHGAVVVDFLPVGGQTLKARAGSVEVDVVGTVFYVVAEQGDTNAEVGVLAGKVKVRRPGKPEVMVKERQRLRRDKTVTEPILRKEEAPISALIDLDRHRLLLQQIKTRPKEVEPTTRAPEPKTSVVPPVALSTPAKSVRAPKTKTRTTRPAAKTPKKRATPAPTTAKPTPTEAAPVAVEAAPPVNVREQARLALKRGDHAEAARHYEMALKQQGPGSKGAAPLRLELTRIYLRHLGRRGNAIRHMRSFLSHHPNDPAAASVRGQLCRILGARAADDPQCADR